MSNRSMPQTPKCPLPCVERIALGERSRERSGGAACAGSGTTTAATSAPASARRLATKHRRDGAVGRGVEARNHVLLRQLGMLEPPAGHLLPRPHDQVAEQLHVLSSPGAPRPVHVAHTQPGPPPGI